MPQAIIAIGAAIGSALVTVGLTVTTAAWVGYIAANAIIFAGAKALIGSLAPDIPSGGNFDSKSRNILLNKKANNAPIPVVYGTRLVGGTIVFLATGTDTKYLYVNLVVSEGVITEYLDIIYDGKTLEIENQCEGSRWKDTEYGGTRAYAVGGARWDEELGVCFRESNYSKLNCSSYTDSNMIWYEGVCTPIDKGATEITCNEAGYYWDSEINVCIKTITEYTLEADAKEYFGTTTQQGNPLIADDLDYYSTSTHRLAGTAYLSLKLEYDPARFPNGFPGITTLIKGVKVFDPRSSQVAWSDNPALCIRDYLTNARYGRGIESLSIDNDTFITSANYCDEVIPMSGQNKKRYTCDGVVQTENTSLDILNELLTSCKGFLVFSGGKYKLILDKPEIPTFTFSEENIIGKWDIVLGSKNTMFNRIRANFFNKDKEYQPDIAVIDSPTLRAKDGGALLERTIDLPFTSDIARAKMISTMNLNQSRQSIVCEFNATIEGLLAEVGDVVYIKHDTPGWSGLNEGQGKKFRITRITLQNNDEVRIQAREYDISAYEYDTIVTTSLTPDTLLPDMTLISPPTGLTTKEELYTTTNSAGVKVRVILSWVEPIPGFIQYYEVAYRMNGVYTTLTNIRHTETTILDVDPGVYNFQVKAINTLGFISEASELNNVTVAGLTAPPIDVSNLSVVGAITTATLSWSLATDVDVLSGGTVIFRHSSAITGATWQNSLTLPSVAAGSSNSIVLPLQVGTYLAKFVDSTGNVSLNADYVVVKTPADIIDPPLKTILTEHPTFAGIKTNMIVVNGELQLDNSTTGTYEFEAPANLGAIKVARVSVHNILEAYLISDTIDDRLTLIDTWLDFDNTPVDVMVQVYISTTNDQVAPITWTPWALFSPGDYEAREVKFKLEVTTSSIQNQISISELSATLAS